MNSLCNDSIEDTKVLDSDMEMEVDDKGTAINTNEIMGDTTEGTMQLLDNYITNVCLCSYLLITCLS